MTRHLLTCCFTLTLVRAALGLGEESLGNRPVDAANYPEGPDGILEVVNDPARVYRRWVNGNEHNYFRGDVIALNAALENFSKLDCEELEVILLPGPAETTTFQRDQQIPYNWRLHYVAGIAGAVRRQPMGEKVWPKHPTLHVYIGGSIQLSELQIPEPIKLVPVSSLRERYVEALQSESQTVRGWTCGRIAEIDPHSDRALRAIAGMLRDEVPWVRLNAAGALRRFGDRAVAVKQQLETALAESDDAKLDERLQTTLSQIAASQSDPESTQFHAAMVKAIEDYCQAHESARSATAGPAGK